MFAVGSLFYFSDQPVTFSFIPASRYVDISKTQFHPWRKGANVSPLVPLFSNKNENLNLSDEGDGATISRPERQYQCGGRWDPPKLSHQKPVYRNKNKGNKKRPRRRYSKQNAQQAPNQTLSNSIDSFLAGEYAHPFSPDAPAPHPGLGPGETIDVCLRALRKLDEPHKCHGAAVFLRFCVPLTRGERWGGNVPPSDHGTGSISEGRRDVRKRTSPGGQNFFHKWPGHDPWKDLLRGALTPPMLARKLRASCHFSGLLDWTSLDVTEGASNPIYVPGEPKWCMSSGGTLGKQSDVAYVNAALFFGQGLAPTIVHFTMKKIGGVWFVDSAVVGSDSEEWNSIESSDFNNDTDYRTNGFTGDFGLL